MVLKITTNQILKVLQVLSRIIFIGLCVEAGGVGLMAANLKSLNMDGADVWFFMAVVLFIIVQVVNRGVEIQQENDLTI